MAKNAQFTKWNIQFFSRGYIPASQYLFHGTLRLSLLSSPIEIYATIGLWIFVSEKEIYVTIVLGYLCWKTTLGPSQGMIQRGWADTPNLLEKTKSTFKCIAKIHASECKANVIENYF